MSLLNSESVREYLSWLDEWSAALPEESLADAIEAAGGPGRVVMLSVDVIKGFTDEGRLASARIAGIVGPIADLFTRAHGAGVRHFILLQDAHPPDSPEFEAYGPHCLAGTTEAETAEGLATLPFVHRFRILPKTSISVAIGTGLDEALDELDPRLIVCVGDCTDLCLYDLATHVKFRANAEKRPWRVVVPADCVNTYDMPVAKAKELGILPHEAELLHPLFLHHLALNAVHVVRRLS